LLKTPVRILVNSWFGFDRQIFPDDTAIVTPLKSTGFPSVPRSRFDGSRIELATGRTLAVPADLAQ